MFNINKELSKKLRDEDVRIVCSNVHHESGEIEIVIEIKEKVSQFKDEFHIVSLWIDKFDVINKIAELNK